MQLAPAHLQPDQTQKPILMQLITPRQCAEICQVDVEQIIGLVESGQLPGYRFNTGQIRIDLGDLRKFADAAKTKRVH
jgi:hypothetical protein